jgi:hypothetical protein
VKEHNLDGTRWISPDGRDHKVKIMGVEVGEGKLNVIFEAEDGGRVSALYNGENLTEADLAKLYDLAARSS